MYKKLSKVAVVLVTVAVLITGCAVRGPSGNIVYIAPADVLRFSVGQPVTPIFGRDPVSLQGGFYFATEGGPRFSERPSSFQSLASGQFILSEETEAYLAQFIPSEETAYLEGQPIFVGPQQLSAIAPSSLLAGSIFVEVAGNPLQPSIDLFGDLSIEAVEASEERMFSFTQGPAGRILDTTPEDSMYPGNLVTGVQYFWVDRNTGDALITAERDSEPSFLGALQQPVSSSSSGGSLSVSPGP